LIAPRSKIAYHQRLVQLIVLIFLIDFADE